MTEFMRVLFEDNHCLAVEKAAGMLMVGDRTGDESLLDRAKQYLKEKYHKPGAVFLGVVHRLDRPVSGVALFARTSKAAARLSEQFRQATTEKIYLAWVRGRPTPTSGTWRDWLLKDESRNVVSVVSADTPGAVDAELSYEVIETARHGSVVRISLKTGRPHQIRVQFTSRGWPILGDRKYGGPAAARQRIIALHAESLRFLHPITQQPVLVQMPRPTEWDDWF